MSRPKLFPIWRIQRSFRCRQRNLCDACAIGGKSIPNIASINSVRRWDGNGATIPLSLLASRGEPPIMSMCPGRQSSHCCRGILRLRRWTMAETTVAYLTVEDLMKMFSVTRETIYDYRKAGKLPEPLKIGKRMLWRADKLDKFLER